MEPVEDNQPPKFGVLPKPELKPLSYRHPEPDEERVPLAELTPNETRFYGVVGRLVLAFVIIAMVVGPLLLLLYVFFPRVGFLHLR